MEAGRMNGKSRETGQRNPAYDYDPEELIPIVSELVWKYAGSDSTSVTYETAQTLMEAVLYCLREYEQASPASPVLREVSVRERYETGAELVSHKAECIRRLFNEMAEDFEDYGVRSLYDTVQKGIPQFLRRYQVRFCPQDTILTLDYPILADCSSLCGADAVFRYLSSVRTEQRFLAGFDRNYIVSVLEKYSPQYRDMVENICGIILADIIGRIAIRKPFEEAGFLEKEYQQLREIFGGKTVEETEKDIGGFIRAMIRQFYGNDANMAEYLCLAARDTAVRINGAVSCGCLDRIFLSHEHCSDTLWAGF